MDSENFKKVGYIILGIILLVTIVIFGYFIKGKFFSSQVKDTAPDISEEKNKPKESEEKSLKEYVKKENLNEYVKFLGFVEYEKTPKIYQEADIFVTSSKTETEGMSTIEAMSTGLPVIGVKERATPYLVGKDAGFIAPIGNSKKIAEYMERLAKNYKLRIKLGKNASLKTKRYEIKSTNKKIYEAYKKIISDFKKRKN